MGSTTDVFPNRNLFPSETIVFQWTLIVIKLLTGNPQQSFPHGFLMKFPQRSLIYSQVSLLQKGLLIHYSGYFPRFFQTRFFSANSSGSDFCNFVSLSCSQKTTSNFWCVYFPSKFLNTQQINIHQVGCLFNLRIFLQLRS